MVAGFVARVFIIVSDTGSIKGTIRNQKSMRCGYKETSESQMIKTNGDGSKNRPQIFFSYNIRLHLLWLLPSGFLLYLFTDIFPAG